MENNSNILDAIVGGASTPVADMPVKAATPRPTDASHSFATGATITPSGVRQIEMKAIGLAAGAYRGCGRDVSKAQNDPKLVQSIADMDWRVVRMPLAIQGLRDPTAYRPYPGMVALVRSDTGTPLAPATLDYKPHQNDQLIKTMCDFASEAGLTLSRVGLFNSGSRGFAVATSGVNREAKVGDMVAMHILLRFGHAPGTATSLRAQAYELRCANGATMEVAAGAARFVHSAELTPGRIALAHTFVEQAQLAFHGHVDKLAMLRGVVSNTALDQLILAKLFQPDLAAAIAARVTRATNARPGDVVEQVLGERVLDAILTRDASRLVVHSMIAEKGERLLNAVVSATTSQPGWQMTISTLAHAYSGVTHFNSNIRGRGAATGLEANLFGNYADDSRKALALAVATAETVRRMN